MKKICVVAVLIPKDTELWGLFVDSPGKFSDDFMDFRRDQGAFERHRDIR